MNVVKVVGIIAALLVALPASAADNAIRIATVPVDAGSEVFYAQQMGFFKDAGLDVTVETYTSGAAIIAGVVSGAIDVGISNLTSLAGARAKGIPVTIVAPAALYVASAPTSVCMVATSSTIGTGRDLDGKTFGTSTLQSSGEVAAEAWIDKTGGDSKTVKFVELPQPEMPAALEAGRVDAVQIDEPHVAAARKVARAIPCFDAIATRFLNVAFFTSDSWANAHRALVRKLEAVVLRTAAWANGHHDATAAILSKVAKVPLATMRTIVRATYAERLDPHDLQPIIDVSARYGAIAKPFPAAELISPVVSAR